MEKRNSRTLGRQFEEYLETEPKQYILCQTKKQTFRICQPKFFFLNSESLFDSATAAKTKAITQKLTLIRFKYFQIIIS